MGNGSFIYLGLENCLKKEINRFGYLNLGSQIFVDCNIDGLPVANSSNKSMWPILCRIIVKGVDTEPFLVAAYVGGTKVNDVDEYLKLFVEELEKLRLEGFYYKNKFYRVYLRNTLFDIPARCQIMKIPHYLSFNSCPRCFIVGVKKGSMIFEGTNFSLRKDETYRQLLAEPYNTRLSPFEKIPYFKPISQVPPDPMHALHLGVFKRVCNYILHESSSKDHLEKIKLISTNLVHLNKFLPVEFHRTFRDFDLTAKKKATEYRKELLYSTPIVFKNVLSSDRYTHIMTLHCASRILTDPEFCIVFNSYAEELLKYYVQYLPLLYAESELTTNAHSLIYLAREVLVHGSLESFSNYPFENYLFQIKQWLRNGRSTLSQIFNRLSECEKANVISYHAKLKKNEYVIGKLKEVDSDFIGKYFKSYGSIKFCNFELRDKFPNNCCYLKDNTVLWISLITKSEDEDVLFVGRKFSNYGSIPNYPCDSRIILCYVVEQLEKQFIEVKLDYIKRKAFLMPFENSSYITMPLLHSE